MVGVKQVDLIGLQIGVIRLLAAGDIEKLAFFGLVTAIEQLLYPESSDRQARNQLLGG
jgi:hypothetical protein